MEFELIKDPDGAAFFSYARQQQVEKEKQDPIVGDTVHLWNGRCYTALVVDEGGAWDAPTVDVYAFTLDGGLGHADCKHDETKGESHTWHWPCGGH